MSNYLKRILEEKHISQNELARRLGVTRGYICDIVHDRQNIRHMPIDKVSRIANIFNISLDEFVKEILKEEN